MIDPLTSNEAIERAKRQIAECVVISEFESSLPALFAGEHEREGWERERVAYRKGLRTAITILEGIEHD